MTILTLKAQQDHLQRIANTRSPIKAISELVWNSLDADSKQVDVQFECNALGGIEAIIVRDNGSGITHERATTDFENVGNSWKRTTLRTADKRAMHGKEGQGRLRFFSIAHHARWISNYKDNGKIYKIEINVESAALKVADVHDPEDSHSETTGTVVQLMPLKDGFDWLLSDEARFEFTVIFAPYLMQYPNITITYNDHKIDPGVAIVKSHSFDLMPIVHSGRVINDISLTVIEWGVGLKDRKIHFGGESGIVLGSQYAGVSAPDFNFSAYSYSPFFQEIADANLLDFEGLNDETFAYVLAHIRDILTDYFRERQAEKSGSLIEDLKAAGIYPYEGDPKDELELRERQVFDIATHAVSSYSRDFKRAENPVKKITLRLLREAVRHNPESISHILHAIFDLPKNRQDEFAGLLKKTELSHIISASSLIADRVVVLEVLKGIVFNPKYRETVKERGELDALVRDNTWLFGERFHISLSEVGLTRIMERVSLDLNGKKNQTKIRKPDGRSGRVDSFLGRSIPHPDANHREYLLLELKRPSTKISRKQLDQIEDYYNSIKSQPDFLNTSTQWNFFLVAGEYDDSVKERITQIGRPIGLFLDKPYGKIWVKAWSELIRENESRLRFVQDKLRISVSNEEIESRIENLKGSIIRNERKQNEYSSV